MNLGRSVVVLRARGVGEVLDLACRFFTAFASAYAKLSALVLVPIFAITVTMRVALEWHWAVVWSFALVFAAIFDGPFTILTSRLMFGERPPVKRTLSLWRSRLASSLYALLLSALLYAVSALVVVGIPFVAVRFIFVQPAVFLEQMNGSASLDRSRRLAGVNWGTSVLAMIGLVASRAVFVLFAELLGAGLVRDVLQLGEPFGNLFHQGGSLYALAGFFLATPFISVARFLHYIDVRTRSDGWDVQVRFMNLLERERAGDLRGLGRAA